MNATLPDAHLETISRLVETQFGLCYPPDRWPELAEGVRAAATALGFVTPPEYARRLLEPDADASLAHALAENLTVGETYFFREPAAFDTLISSIIPALARERTGRARRLRIWSAGCCSGEEPYSIGMALRRALPDFRDWHITILATDVNPRFLHKAAAGIYGDWSFRGVPKEVRQMWFRPTPDGRSKILPTIRNMVSFACLNLAEDVYPSLFNNTNAMDLIFCRHVLMYFSAAQRAKAIAHLHASLAPGGLLLVSMAEASQALSEAIGHAEFPALPLYRKGAVLSPTPTPLPARRPVEPIRPSLATPPPAPLRDYAREARALANEGRFSAALAACELALHEDRLVASHHYLRGVILQEQNELEEAAAALQRALYLDQDFAVAHFTLGHLRLRQGREDESARCFANARAVLARSAAEDLLPESDGMTAGRLFAILDSMREVLA